MLAPPPRGNPPLRWISRIEHRQMIICSTRVKNASDIYRIPFTIILMLIEGDCRGDCSILSFVHLAQKILLINNVGNYTFTYQLYVNG